MLLSASTKCLIELKRLIAAQKLMTLSLDGWSNVRMASIYAFNLVLHPGRQSRLWRTLDLSSVSHTAENLAGEHPSICLAIILASTRDDHFAKACAGESLTAASCALSDKVCEQISAIWPSALAPWSRTMPPT